MPKLINFKPIAWLKKNLITEIPAVIIVCVSFISAAMVFGGFWRRGTVLFGIMLLTLGLLIVIFPESRFCKILARGKRFDGLLLIILGIAVIYLSLSIKSLGT